MYAETIFYGGPVLSPHVRWTPAEAIAVRGDRVVAFGSRAEVEATAGPSTKRVNLEGRALIPGLIDAHLHILEYAFTLDRLAVAGMPSLAAVGAAVAERAALRAPGEWIQGRGWDQDRWAEKRLPTRFDLDQVAPHHPVYLQRNCNHIGVVNSAALALAGITRDTSNPEGGQIDRDPATGEPTGVLRERAQELIWKLIPPVPQERRRTLLRKAMQEALSYGITQVHTDDVDRAAGGFEQAEELFGALVGPEAIPLRITQMIPGAWVEEADRRGIHTRTGTEWYRYGQAKIFSDGSLGGRTAALLEPYADAPETRGIYIHAVEEFNDLVVRAHRLGNQVGCHAIGDGGAKLFIDAVAEAQRRYPRGDARHRIIHAQILSERLMDRMAEQQIVADIQPVFLKSDGYWFADRVGQLRARTCYAWKSLIRRGIPVCGGSDCPIEPLNIWLGIYTAVNRQDLNGFPEGGWMPEEKLTVAETLNMYTAGASYSTFEEGFKGSLAPGMAADLLVLDRDPFRCDPRALKDVRVHLTMVGGRIGYQA